VIDMHKVDNQIAAVPLAPSPSADLPTSPAEPQAGRRVAQGAQFAGLGKRTASMRDAEADPAAHTAAPRVALPKAGVAGGLDEAATHPRKRPFGAPRLKAGADAERKEEPLKADAGEHTGAASHKPEEPQPGDHAPPHADHAAHAAHHHTQIAAAKARLDRQKRVSDHHKRMAELRGTNLAKLVGN